MAKIRIGVVGCGVIGTRHMQAAAASPLIELTAVADPIEERARARAAEFHVPGVFRQGLDLVKDPSVDAVVLAIPTGGRAALAREAFRLGKHVLLEKPPAMSAAEIEELMTLAGDRVGACCSSRFTFLAGFRAARAEIESGRLGDLREVYVRALFGADRHPTEPPPAWRVSRAQNGGGILVNWGTYDLDYLLALTGWTLEPRSVFAQTWRVAPHLSAHVAPGSDAESHYVALIRCAGGEMIHVERAEFSAIANETAWQVIGTHGSLRLSMTFSGEKTLFVDETSAASGVSSRVLWQGTEDEHDYHKGPVLDFAAAILEKRPPRTDLRKALVLQKIFDAVYESSASGKLAVITPPRGR
jgi:predicted dehydrogenase